MGSGRDALAILLDGRFLEAIEVAQERLPFGLEIFGLVQPQQFLAECERPRIAASLEWKMGRLSKVALAARNRIST